MIEWWNAGDPVDLDDPRPGLWEARCGSGVESWLVARVEVTEGQLKMWARLCALAVAHLLPVGVDPVLLRWLEAGDDALLVAASWASWKCGSADIDSWVKSEPRVAVVAAWWAVNAADAAWWAASAAGGTDCARRGSSRAALFARQADSTLSTSAILTRLIWEAHGETIPSVNDRLKLARTLRYHCGDVEAAAAVVPPEFREVTP